MDKLQSLRLHSQEELENARTKGQVIGWAQGAAVTFGAMLVLNFLGWIPALLILALLGFLGFKLATAGKRKADAL